MEISKAKNIVEYRNNINSILNTPLTPKNFTNYASDALSGIIKLLVDYYQTTPDLKFRSYDKTLENEILNILGFSGSLIIESLAQKVEQISNVDRIANLAIGTSIDTNKEKTTRKLEVVLYLLLEEFGVDFNDRNQFEINTGYVLPNYERSSQFYIITSPVVNTTILVCNDSTADTYIFDNMKLRENKIFTEKIKKLTTSENDIQTLINQIPGIGISIESEEKLLNRVLPAIKACIYNDLLNYQTDKYDKDRDVALLKNKSIQAIPDGYLFIFDFANRLGINVDSLKTIINSLSEKLGEIKLYKLYIGKIEPCLSVEQQAIVERAYKSIALIPPGFIPVQAFMSNLGINRREFDHLKDLVFDKIGSIENFRLNIGSIDLCLSQEQQNILTEKYNSYPIVPDGFVTLSNFAQSQAIKLKDLEKLIRNHFGSVNSIDTYRVRTGSIEECLSPSQQQQLNQIDIDGDELPNEYVTLSSFAKNLGFDEKILAEIIVSTGIEFGVIEKFQIGIGRVESCLSPSQQQILRDIHDKYPEMPSDYKPISLFSASESHDVRVVERMIEALGDHIGKISAFLTPIGKIEKCLSQDQQNQLTDLLKL